jgi:hypothetical protein
MATTTKVPDEIDTITPYHDYHAEAHVLSGHLKRPIDQKIEHQAQLHLHDRRGGHFTRFTETVSVEGLLSYAKGKTRVSGSRSPKHNGWVTLSTSVIEGLNAFEVITADRIVGQVSTDHPYRDGHYPHVTFLGSQFTNFRVSGFEVELNLNFGVCGSRPADNRSYLRDLTFLETVQCQTEAIAKADGLPKELKSRYDERLVNIHKLIRQSTEGVWENDEPRVICSLVESIGEIPIPGVKSYGHVLVIPEFGSVSLGEIAVGERNYEKVTGDKSYEKQNKPSVYFTLTGIKMDMGCVGDGMAMAATVTANGHSHP